MLIYRRLPPDDPEQRVIGDVWYAFVAKALRCVEGDLVGKRNLPIQLPSTKRESHTVGPAQK